MGPDGECPQSFTAEVVGSFGDGTPVLVAVSFAVRGLEPDDPRQPGDGFVYGQPCLCLVEAFGQMARALASGQLEFLR